MRPAAQEAQRGSGPSRASFEHETPPQESKQMAWEERTSEHSPGDAEEADAGCGATQPLAAHIASNNSSRRTAASTTITTAPRVNRRAGRTIFQATPHLIQPMQR